MPYMSKLFECEECGTLLEMDQGNESLLPCNECDSKFSKQILILKKL